SPCRRAPSPASVRTVPYTRDRKMCRISSRITLDKNRCESVCRESGVNIFRGVIQLILACGRARWASLRREKAHPPQKERTPSRYALGVLEFTQFRLVRLAAGCRGGWGAAGSA